MILFCKGIFNQAKLPTEVLQEPTRTTKNMHNLPFRQISTNSDTYKHSFMPRTIKDWNSVPSNIICQIQTAADPAKSFASVVRGGKI